MSAPWDVLVVGGGTAGIVSAKTAASFGARVLLVERERTGGDCLWTGCVPSKALLAAASVAARGRTGDRLGISVDSVSVDFTAVMAHVHSAIRTIEPVDSPAALEAAGVHVQHGDLSFSGTHTATVDGRPLEFRQAIVCTGSSPVVPQIPGLDAVEPLTSDTVWDLDVLPERLAIIGGGNIGCELGQAFARLGAQVTILEGGDRILSKEDSEAAALVSRSLVRDGVTVVTGSQVTEVRRGDGSDALVLDDGGQVEFDRVLVSVGRSPGTRDLGLERAGVELDDRGYLRVDNHLRSTNPDVWAAGDVTGHPQFTHVAGVHGSLAASNAVLGLRRRVDTSTVPRVTYTDPEVAAVGVGTASAADNAELHVVTREHGHVDRAVAEGDTDGFAKLVVDGKGRILGGTVVGPRAGETLGELSVAVKHGLRTRDLAGTTHAYPTYKDGVWNAAIDDVKASLSRPTTARAIALLAAGRRRWVGSAARERLLQARSR